MSQIEYQDANTAYTIQDGVRICVCDFARLLIFYYYGRNGSMGPSDKPFVLDLEFEYPNND